jgi:hypothetical protein
MGSLSLLVIVALGQTADSLPNLVFKAHPIVEARLERDGALKLQRVLSPSVAEPDARLLLNAKPFSPRSRCWKKARARGSLKVLLFFERGTAKQLTGPGHEEGRYSELDPSYPQLVEAVERSQSWQDERMRAVPAALLWQEQRLALRSDNAYLVLLAAEFLNSHGGGAALEETWGQAGSTERERNEKRARLPPANACR